MGNCCEPDEKSAKDERDYHTIEDNFYTPPDVPVRRQSCVGRRGAHAGGLCRCRLPQRGRSTVRATGREHAP